MKNWSLFYLMKITLLIVVLYSSNFHSQKLYFKKIEFENPEFENKILTLNKELLKIYNEKDSLKYLDNHLRFQMLNGDKEGALSTINKLRLFFKNSYPDYSRIAAIQFEIFILARKENNTNDIKTDYEKIFKEKYRKLPIQSKVLIPYSFKYKKGHNKKEINKILRDSIVQDSISLKNAILLCKNYNTLITIENTFSIAEGLVKNLDEEEFLVRDSIIIKTKKGNELSLGFIKYKKEENKVPAILNFSIYNKLKFDSAERINTMKGYVIVNAFSKGVYLSKDEIAPFKFETEDVNEVINWIIKQPWSNGKVGMIGGSYDGFSQWAATKNIHQALKTIIPYVSVGFGIDFPMENNVFNTYMIRWSEYVMKSRYSEYDDSSNNKWIKLVNKLYKKGVEFKKLDILNGNNDPIFQEWLKHPSFDKFWQSKIPYKKDFAKINIPILTFTGYFDDDQRGAMYYYNEHHKYNKNPNHYLVIGPYDHFGAQGSIKNNMRGYIIDSTANIDIDKLSYEWFDYILKGKEKPKFLKDKINYQVMATNQWKNAPSIDKISNKKLKLFLSNYKLLETKPISNYISQKIDLSNRKDTLQNFDRYKILDSVIDSRILNEKLIFESNKFDHPFEINGSFIGNIKTSINKKDIDITIKLFESMPNGKYFLLSSYLGRASYAKNKEKRQLLTPDRIEEIPIHNTYFVSKKIEKGSKLIVVLGVNKTPYEQINYGTGKDVSEETIADAKEPLEIKWYNDSYIEIPIMQE
ncbi:Cocaine esterase [Chryseobacterium aquaeductus]|uniref:Cocaine esterase n=1 Tax=Chryseobacterium aquaeductus TaxID=2675056 RepID=A0A9N8MNC8_9FLAO|nr:CocE/NonD family hydrolase [Chryseobacterium aquaeductus]CAA7330848.1 Cocaine esterase [Chryseobacterium potabilaquae]CAD7806509.1 Cocaine esterase [Chryseobacterium aquaeductus]